jgi:hypothetical protein
MVITTTFGSLAEFLAAAPTAAAAASEAAKTEKTLTFMQWGNYIAFETGESRNAGRRGCDSPVGSSYNERRKLMRSCCWEVGSASNL